MIKWLERFILCATIVGMIYAGEAYFAKAAELEQVELRLDQKIVNDAVDQTDQRLWAIEQRNQGKTFEKWSVRDQKEYRELQRKSQDLETKQKVIMERVK